MNPPDLDTLLAARRRTPPTEPPPPPLLARLRGLVAAPDDTPADAPAVERVPATVGPYRVVGVRGRGGVGVVYEATDPTLGRRVAVKVLLAGEFASPVERKRFVREAQVAAAVRHDHLVPVYAADDPADGPAYLAMPFIDGPTLAEAIREAGALPPRRAAEIARQIADALTAVHAADCWHRDVKPGNVLLDAADGRAKLADFGLVRLVAGDSTMTLGGTPGYAAPEILSNGRPDQRADVYGLGATLYQALAGVPPFRGSTADVLRMTVADDPVPPGRLNRAIPRDLETVCLKALAKDPAERYQSAAALRDDLDRFLAGRPVVARPAGVARRTLRWGRRNPLLAGLAAALVLAVAAGAASGFVLWRRAEARGAVAEDRLKQVRAAVDRFYVRVAEEELLDQPGLQPLRRKLLADAAAHYRAVVDAARDDPAARDDLAAALDKLGAAAVALGDGPAAVAALRDALAIAVEAAVADPSIDRRAAVAAAEARLADGYRVANDPAAAVAAATRAGDAFAALAAERPDRWEYRRDEALARITAGQVQLDRGGPPTAPGHPRAAELLEPLAAERPDDLGLAVALADALNGVAVARMAAADIPTLERVRDLRATVSAGRPDSMQVRFAAARAEMNLGVLYKWSGRTADAAAAYERAAAALERLTEDGPRVPTYRRNLGRVRHNLANIHADAGRFAAAVADGRAARAAFDAVRRASADDLGVRVEWCVSAGKLAEWTANAGDPAAADDLAAALDGIAAAAPLAAAAPIQADRLRTAAGGAATAAARLGPRADRPAVAAFFRWCAANARDAAPGDLNGVLDLWADALPDDPGRVKFR